MYNKNIRQLLWYIYNIKKVNYFECRSSNNKYNAQEFNSIMDILTMNHATIQ